jgi:hypothetical protein
VGPRHEREGSFHTVRDVFSPVQIDAPVLDEKFSGKLVVHNRYDMTSLAECKFAWSLLRFPDATAARSEPGTARALVDARAWRNFLRVGVVNRIVKSS